MLLRGLLLVPALAAACAAQSRPDLFECEGCEAICERPANRLTAFAIIADSAEPGDRMRLVGRVFRTDGRTPAPGVVVYVHHTNVGGEYPARPGDTGWARRHGYLRGWVVTDAAGDYRFDSIRPAPYPGGDQPAHIHVTVKEPGRQEYWIDEIVFTDDTLVTDAYRRAQGRRGGSGIVTPTRGADGVWLVRRDIVLER